MTKDKRPDSGDKLKFMAWQPSGSCLNIIRCMQLWSDSFLHHRLKLRCFFVDHCMLTNAYSCHAKSNCSCLCPLVKGIGAVVWVCWPSSQWIMFNSQQKLQFSYSLLNQSCITVLHVFWSACKILDASLVSIDYQFAMELPHTGTQACMHACMHAHTHTHLPYTHTRTSLGKCGLQWLPPAYLWIK